MIIQLLQGIEHRDLIFAAATTTLTSTSSVHVFNNDFHFSSIFSDFNLNIRQPLSILLLQIISIIIVAKIFGYLFRRIGQPTVIGEIIAGIILGPSILGAIYPPLSQFLFPVDSLNNLQFLSHFGLILFIFIIGMELDTSLLKNKTKSAMLITLGSVFIPFSVGFAFSLYLYPAYGNEGNSYLSFALFMGTAMSIAALPVLARIIQERQLTKTYTGTFAIMVAAVNDVIGWFLLAISIAIVRAENAISALYTVFFTVLYVILMLYVVRPLFNRIGNIYVSKENLNKTIIAMVFLFLFISSYLTEIIGIHALFGAFVAGVVIPKNQSFRNILIEKIEDISLVILLPLFFVFTGLRTNIGLLNDMHLWSVCLFIILISVISMMGGTSFFAKITGHSWKESLTLGVLMNTRGLMELIVLNIGYDLGILSAEIFTMFVIMALVTTFMTSPLLNLINKLTVKKEKIFLSESGIHKILLSFANPMMGSKLLRLSCLLSGKKDNNCIFTAVHFTPASGIETKNISQFEEEVFKPVKAAANEMGINLNTIYRVTEHVQKEIVSLTSKDQYHLLLVGAAKSVFIANFTGGRIKGLISRVTCNLGIFIDRDFNEPRKFLIVIGSEKDIFLAEYGIKLLEYPDIHLKFAVNHVKIQPEKFSEKLNLSVTLNKAEITTVEPDLNSINQQDIVIISLEYWFKNRNNKIIWNNQRSSLLIMRQSYR